MQNSVYTSPFSHTGQLSTVMLRSGLPPEVSPVLAYSLSMNYELPDPLESRHPRGWLFSAFPVACIIPGQLPRVGTSASSGPGSFVTKKASLPVLGFHTKLYPSS